MRVAKNRLVTRTAIGVACLLVVLVTVSDSGGFLVCSEAPQPVDLILVIGGDFYGPRVIKGAELALAGYAPLVLISGPPYGGSRSEAEFGIDFLTAKGYPRYLFQSFGHQAHSTVSEAIAVCPELQRRHVHRVILVTSSYHSRRADIVFRLFCPKVHFISVPARDPHYDPEHWWKDTSSRRLFFSEWVKIFGSVLVAYPERLLRIA